MINKVKRERKGKKVVAGGRVRVGGVEVGRAGGGESRWGGGGRTRGGGGGREVAAREGTDVVLPVETASESRWQKISLRLSLAPSWPPCDAMAIYVRLDGAGSGD